MFDAQSFLAGTIKGSNSTTLPPLPVGDYTAIISELRPRQNSDGSVVMDVVWSIDDENLKAELGRKVITVRQSIWLDLTPDGDIDDADGKNIQLGRLREAVGQNWDDREWGPSMLIGAAALIRVTNEVDKNGETRDKVTRVTSLV